MHLPAAATRPITLKAEKFRAVGWGTIYEIAASAVIFENPVVQPGQNSFKVTVEHHRAASGCVHPHARLRGNRHRHADWRRRRRHRQIRQTRRRARSSWVAPSTHRGSIAGALAARHAARLDRGRTPAPTGGERRQLTVMFVDLVGSTAMAEEHEPEAVRDVLEHYQEISEHAITAHRGTISDYIGDGIMAYFGFPEAREDDARQAVLAGLELLAALDEMAATVRREQGIELAARVGIHTGVVLVGEMGAAGARRHDSIIGTTPNQAARLQTLAPEGAVVISDDTHEIVRGFFTVESLGRPAMKGIARDVEVFRVIGPTAAVHRLQTEGSVGDPVRGASSGAAATARAVGRRGHRVRVECAGAACC